MNINYKDIMNPLARLREKGSRFFTSVNFTVNIRNIIKNSFCLAAAQGVNGLANFFIVIYLARMFGPIDYGKFAYALSFVMLFSTFFDFGLTVAMTREFARDKSQEKNFLGLLFLKSIIGLFAVCFIFGLSYLITQDLTIRKMIFFLGLYQLFVQSLNIFYAVFRARQRMEFEAFIRFFQVGNFIFFAMIMIHYQHSIVAVSYAYAMAAFFCLVMTMLVMFMSSASTLLHTGFKIDLSACKRFLMIGSYLALAQGVNDVMVNTDSFLLGYWGLLKGVGYYNVASKINAMVLFPMSILSTAIFPVLISALKNSRQELMWYWKLWAQYTILIAVFIAFLVIAEASEIIHLLYGDLYLPAALALKILMVMAIVLYTSNFYFQVLLIFDQQKPLFYVLIGGTIVNVILNILLIPKWGIEGSAVATIAGQLMNGICYMIILSKKTFFNPLDLDFLGALCAAVVSGMSMWLYLSLIQTSIYYAVIEGLFLYLILFFIIKYGVYPFAIRQIDYVKS